MSVFLIDHRRLWQKTAYVESGDCKISVDCNKFDVFPGNCIAKHQATKKAKAAIKGR